MATTKEDEKTKKGKTAKPADKGGAEDSKETKGTTDSGAGVGINPAEEDIPVMEGVVEEDLYLTPADTRSLASLKDVDEAFEMAANRAMLMKKIRHLVLSTMDPEHFTIMKQWSDTHKKYVAIVYMNATGSDYAGRQFGVTSRLVPFPDGHLHQKVWEKDPDTDEPIYAYHCIIEAFLSKSPDEKVQTSGFCNTRDGMFQRSRTVNGKKEKYYLSASEVDEKTVKGKCETNGYNKAVKRLLGLSKITVKELGRAGLNLNEAQGFVFRKSAKGGEIPATEAQFEVLLGVLQSTCSDFNTNIIPNLRKIQPSKELIDRMLKHLETLDTITKAELEDYIRASGGG